MGARDLRMPKNIGSSVVLPLLDRGAKELSFMEGRGDRSITVYTSEDGGKTWTTDYVIDDQGQSGDLGYPATVELKDGSLLTLYYENRDGVSRIMYNVWKLPL